MRTYQRIIPAVALASAVIFSGCSSKTRASITTDVKNVGTEVSNAAAKVKDNTVEVAARNVATQQGEEQFKNAGHELNGPLTCEAKIADSAKKVDVTCSGTTKSGGVAVLNGTTDEVPGASVNALTGRFVGTVDGTSVFTTDRLGG